MLVCDTCAILAWSLDDIEPGLSAPTRARLAGGEAVIVSSLSACEIAWKTKIGKLDIGMSARSFWRRLRSAPIRIVDPDADLWFDAAGIGWAHRDPVDRAIVALARREGADLVTCDRRMPEVHPRCVW